MQNKRRIITSLLLLTLFVAYQVNITMFAHVHYVNGVMLVHSHPSADSQHTHTEGQILTLAQVSHWVGSEPVGIELADLIPTVSCTLLCNAETSFTQDKYAHCISLRAPPVQA